MNTEVQGRQRRALERRLRAARLPARTPAWRAFDFTFQPSLGAAGTASSQGWLFVPRATNIVLLGPPGVGKTHLASGLAIRAIEAGYTALFTTLSQLAETLEATPHPSLWRQRLRRYLQPKVLVIDQVGYTRLTAEQARRSFDLVTARYEAGTDHLDQQHQLYRVGHLVGRRRGTGNGALGSAAPSRGGALSLMEGAIE